MKKKTKKTYTKENNCLNCNAILQGQFCSQCGQKAFIHKDNFFHLTFEFIADYFHFDGKFFHTLQSMFTHPGRITKAYIEGKRKTYLNPIQMYIFVSALFFIFLTSITNTALKKYHTLNQKEQLSWLKTQEAYRDSVLKHGKYNSNFGISILDYGFMVNNKVFRLHDYDSIENSLPDSLKEGWLKRKYHERLLNTNGKRLDARTINSELIPFTMIKSLPKAFFILLPIFGLIVFLFFRNFPYADHIIFSFHFHTIGFIFLALFIALGWWINAFIGTLLISIVAGLAIYLLLSLKHAYGQSWTRTVFKYIGIITLYGTVLGITFILFFIISMVIL